MFCYGGYFNNPYMMTHNYFMPNYSFNFAMPNFSFNNPLNFFSSNIFSNNIFSGSLMHNNLYSVPQLPAFSNFSTQPTYSAVGSSSTNFFNFLNRNSSINTTRTRSTSRSEEPLRRATLNVSAKGLGPEFLARVKEIANKINCDYRDLLGVMNSESGLNSKAVNPHGGATGLIQFMPKTAEGLGTSTAALKAMTPLEQLDYVEKFLVQNKKSAGFSSSAKLSGGDLYALVFLPGRAKRDVLTTSNEKYYTWNKGLDANKDGQITKTELDQRVAKKCVNESIFA